MISRILPITFFLFFFTFAKAQENNEVDTLKFDRLLNLSFEDLMNVSVVTPTLNLQKSNDVPATVRVITMEQIKIRGYRNLSEVLNDLPDFTINDKSDPQFYGRVSARGVSRQDYFVILLDGVRISSPTNEPLPLLENFPIYLAKQIEVVYGPGSALYGADAMGGVINIITQKPGYHGNVTATVIGGTQGYNNTSAVVYKKFKNELNFSIAGQYSYDQQPDFSKIYKDQYSMTSHETGVFNTSFGTVIPQQPVRASFEAPIKAYNFYSSIDKNGFAMKILHQYIAVPTSTTLKPDNAVYNKNVYYGQGLTTGSATYRTDVGKFKSISTLIASNYAVNPKSNFRNLYGGMEHGYKYSTGSMMKMEEQINYSGFKKLSVVAGITYEFFQSVPKTPELQSPVSRRGAANGVLLNSVSPNNPKGIEAKFFPLAYTNMGSYLQVQYFPVEKISFTGGLRYDQNSRFGFTLNPRIGLVIRPFKNTTLKALYGTAYWAPSPMVSFESYGSFYTTDNGTTYKSSFWHLPNPGLKPMTSQTFELSADQKIGDNITVTMTAYKTRINNLIQDVPDNGNTNLYGNKFLGWEVDNIDVPFNRGIQNNHGGNVAINTTFNLGHFEFNAYSSLSYIQGTESQPTLLAKFEQAAITPWQLRVGVDGKLKAFHFSIRLLQAGRQRTARFVTNDTYRRQTIDGYSLVNISTGYTLKKVTLFANVQNALNQHYLNALPFDSADSDGSFQNPIRVMFGVRVGF